MDNLALLPVENYGFWQCARTPGLFKVISIASPYCYRFESELFTSENSSTIPDIDYYEDLLVAIGRDISRPPYELAKKLPLLDNSAVLAVTVQLRVLWHQHMFRGVLSQNRNRFELQFKSRLTDIQGQNLMYNINSLAKMVNQ